MVTQGQRIRDSLAHRPPRTGERPRVDPARMPPSSRDLQARRARLWSEFYGMDIAHEMSHS